MKVFVTGASGFIGSAVVQELQSAGHQVLGLARSDKSADALSAAGAQVLRGDLEDLDSLRSGATQSDAIAHLAFIHDFSKFAENAEIDRRAIEAMGSVILGTEKPLVATSGTALFPSGQLAVESDVPASGHHPRVASEEAVAALAAQDVRASLIRLSPSVHDKGDHGFVPMLIQLAKEKGVAAYIGEGNNVWPAVHRLDAARLYRLALEKGATGATYHGVGERGVRFGDIAAVIGKRLNVPVVSLTPEEAKEHFGWFAYFTGVDNPTSSEWTRQQLGWEPKGIGLLEDIDSDYYFGQ